jgi:glycosyltransferase involved in cell wall biosynthesis
MTKVIYIGYYNPKSKGNSHNQTGHKIEKQIRNILDLISTDIYYINIIPFKVDDQFKHIIHEKNIERNTIIDKLSWAFKLFLILNELKISITDNLHIITYNHNFLTKAILIIYEKTKSINIISTQLLMDYPAPLVYRIYQTKIRNYVKGLFDLIHFTRYNNFIGLSEYYHPILNGKNYQSVRFPYFDLKYNSNNVSNNKIINIGYFGSLEAYNGIYQLLELSRLLENNCNIHIFGRGSLESKITIESRKSNNIHFHGFIGESELLFKTMSKMDLLIFLSGNLKLHKFQFPSKIYDYLASGIPTIINNIGSIDNRTSHYLIKIIKNDLELIIQTIYMFRDLDSYRKDKIRLANKGKKYMELVSSSNTLKREISNIIIK